MSVSFVGSGAVSYVTGGLGINPGVPGGVAAGDNMLAFVSAGASGLNIPSGWVQVGTFEQGTNYFMCYSHTAGSPEPASYSWSYGSNISMGGVILAWTGVVNSALDVNGGAGATLTAPSVTTTKPNDQVVVAYAAGSGAYTLTLPTGVGQRFGASLGALDTIAIGDFPQSVAGATPTEIAASTGPSASAAAFTVALSGAFTAPAAPSLSAPPNTSYADAAGAITFTATYNSTDGASQSAYAMEIMVSGASAFSYWNASTSALQSTIVWNANSAAVGTQWSVTLPAALLADGNTYLWSMASQEAGASLQGPFAPAFSFVAQAGPVVTVTAPTGTVTATDQPTATWTETLASGGVQTAYQIIVESGTYGTVPGAGTAVWASGVVSSSALSAPIAAVLANASYRVFVQITQTGPQLSPWAYNTFTVTYTPPTAPTVSAVSAVDPTTGMPFIQITVTAAQTSVYALVGRSDGIFVAGASPTNPAFFQGGSLTLVAGDYEATAGIEYTYTAWTYA